jgi:hypothetical protein
MFMIIPFSYERFRAGILDFDSLRIAAMPLAALIMPVQITIR